MKGAPGTTGTPASTATRRAEVFSPIAVMASGRRPDEHDARVLAGLANAAFSERNP